MKWALSQKLLLIIDRRENPAETFSFFLFTKHKIHFWAGSQHLFFMPNAAYGPDLQRDYAVCKFNCRKNICPK
jgi:hypothetical protein